MVPIIMEEQQPLNEDKLDSANPHFLHHSDHQDMILVFKPFNGYGTHFQAF